MALLMLDGLQNRSCWVPVYGMTISSVLERIGAQSP